MDISEMITHRMVPKHPCAWPIASMYGIFTYIYLYGIFAYIYHIKIKQM